MKNILIFILLVYAIIATGYSILLLSDFIDEEDAYVCASERFESAQGSIANLGYTLDDFEGPTRIAVAPVPYAYEWTFASDETDKRSKVVVLVDWGCSTELLLPDRRQVGQMN